MPSPAKAKPSAVPGDGAAPGGEQEPCPRDQRRQPQRQHRAQPVADGIAAEAHYRHRGREGREGEAGGLDRGAELVAEIERAPVEDGALGNHREERHDADGEREEREARPRPCRACHRCLRHRRIVEDGGDRRREDDEPRGQHRHGMTGDPEAGDQHAAARGADEAAEAPPGMAGRHDRAAHPSLDRDRVGVHRHVHAADEAAEDHEDGRGGPQAGAPGSTAAGSARGRDRAPARLAASRRGRRRCRRAASSRASRSRRRGSSGRGPPRRCRGRS